MGTNNKNASINSNGIGHMVDDRNLTSLNEVDKVRKKPSVIFGTNDEAGAYHGIWEVITNSIDEAREGYGKQIDVTIEKDHIVTVEDEGRGLPMDWNPKENKYNWQLALCSLYSSGKYDSTQYGGAAGTNGLGLTAMQFASSYMKVWSTYNNRTYYIEFKKGLPACELKIMDPIKAGTGTKIEFQPDPEVFPNLADPKTVVNYSQYFLDLRRQAMLIPGLLINFTHYTFVDEETGKPKTIPIIFKNGIVDAIDMSMEISNVKPIIANTQYYEGSAEGTDRPEDENYTVKMRFAFNFGRVPGEWSDFSQHIEVYHDGMHMFEGGKTLEALKNGLIDAFNGYAMETKKLKKNEMLNFDDISDIAMIIVATDAPGFRTYFKNQTKGAITNKFIGSALHEFITNSLIDWMNKDKDTADKVVDEMVANMQARIEAKAVSKKVINKLSKAVSFNNKPQLFVDCSSKDVSKRELYIVEGRSAFGSTQLARDPHFQAVLPVRGKTINCLKNKLTDVINSDIIIDTYRVLGCGIEAKSKYVTDLPKFNINKLNYDKIIICTDADVDGGHIRCLLITAFYVLSPSLLKEGKVYIVETPLYDIKVDYQGKWQSIFAYTDAEKDRYLKILHDNGITDKKIVIGRSKGLGENNAEMMHQTTMDPKNRHMIRVKYPETDAEIKQMHDYFNALLGDDLAERKNLITDYFKSTEDEVPMYD